MRITKIQGQMQCQSFGSFKQIEVSRNLNLLGSRVASLVDDAIPVIDKNFDCRQVRLLLSANPDDSLKINKLNVQLERAGIASRNAFRIQMPDRIMNVASSERDPNSIKSVDDILALIRVTISKLFDAEKLDVLDSLKANKSVKSAIEKAEAINENIG